MDKIKIELEYLIQTSPAILYNCMTTPSGLSEWFADNVNIKGEYYTFIWDGSEEVAKLLTTKKAEAIRFQWESDEGEDYYFEMMIRIDSLTKEVALIITDFSEEDEVDEIKLMWDNSVNKLKQAIGG